MGMTHTSRSYTNRSRAPGDPTTPKSTSDTQPRCTKRPLVQSPCANMAASPSNTSSAVSELRHPVLSSTWPTRKPGVLASTMNMVMPREPLACASVLAATK